MSCSDDENVCSVKKENNLGYYRLHTIWRKDGFFINITSKNGAWRGEMTPGDVAKMSGQLEIEPETYLSQCKKALTSHGGQTGMVYSVEDGCFAWKKIEDEDSGIKIKMGSVMLEPASFVDTIQNLVTAALNSNRNLQDKLKKVTDEKEKAVENRNDLRNKLNDLIEKKDTMENDLYSRFLLLINEKKKKILQLENQLEELYRNQKTGKGNPYEVDTDNDSEYEEKKALNIKGRKEKRKKITINKKISAKDSPEEKKIKNSDEDIFMEDYEDTVSLQPCTSKDGEKSKKESQELSLATAKTKDELFDFFYGEV